MEKREPTISRTTFLRLAGHCCGGPSGVAAHSTAARSRPSSVSGGKSGTASEPSGGRGGRVRAASAIRTLLALRLTGNRAQSAQPASRYTLLAEGRGSAGSREEGAGRGAEPDDAHRVRRNRS